VTGFVFHPLIQNILYCRTDIGGLYRFDFEENSWIPLSDHVTHPGKWETMPLAIALDPAHPSFVYAVAGDNEVSKVLFSSDYGENWTYRDTPLRVDTGTPVRIHGNGPGRSSGERLIVDPLDPDILYLATPADGLWRTEDACKTWRRLTVGTKDYQEMSFTFVELLSLGAGTRCIVVGTSGQAGSPDGKARGQSVYISRDGGFVFSPIGEEPRLPDTVCTVHPGVVGQRACTSGKYLFVSYSNIVAPSLTGEDYAWYWTGCVAGKFYDGAIVRFCLDDEGYVTEITEVTPPDSAMIPGPYVGEEIRLPGFSGVAADPCSPGTLMCATVNGHPDAIYRSTDFGDTWHCVLSGLEIGEITFTVPYQAPKYSGGKTSGVHGISDIKINPFNANMAIFNTGIGVFLSAELPATDTGEGAKWITASEGMEETVHLQVYSPPSGPMHVIDMIGDYGGFVVDHPQVPPENTFADKEGFRWITMMNADYPDCNPQMLIATPRGNWTGETKGGLIISRDQGRTWDMLPDPIGIFDELDQCIMRIKRPNVTSGWAAISSDGAHLVWSVGEHIPAAFLVWSEMNGPWAQSIVTNIYGKRLCKERFKVLSDRVNPNQFYGFSEMCDNKASIYVSLDYGRSFTQARLPDNFPAVDLSGIDSEMPYEIRIQSKKPGIIWLALLEHGLWRLEFDQQIMGFRGTRHTSPGDVCNRIGLGMPFITGSPDVLFTSGTLHGEYGFFRSEDEGESWKHIDDGIHFYGDIRTISGDPRIFGRVYIGTGSRGLLYGDPA